MQRPSTPAALRDFDASRLDRLLDLVGPNLSAELLQRLTDDLAATQQTLQEAAQVTDWARLREASHVLISLSGSVGAQSLQTLAKALNAVAHQQDSAARDVLLQPLMPELQALIALIRSTGPARRTSE
jgi:HPt (histidine-containing phosphotransfer) domain-containing protein